jgi:tetratricopeptide (TPR) repeat protein
MKRIIMVLLFITFLLGAHGQKKVNTKCRRLCDDKTKIDIQKSIAFYENRLLEIPADQESYYSLGLCFLKLKEVKKAIQYLDTLINLNPNYTAALSNRGLCKSFLGDQQGACADFKKSVEIGQDLKVIDNMKLSEYIKIKCDKTGN